MLCPVCGEEMKTGFVRSTARGGICWVDNKIEWGAPRGDAGFFPIGKSPWMKSSCVRAYHCASCKKVIVDYSALV